MLLFFFIIFTFAFFFFKIIYAGGLSEEMHCSVVRTIESCMKAEKPWKAPKFENLYHYISTGYELNQNFSLAQYTTLSSSGGNKNVYSGLHINPITDERQSLVMKYLKNDMKGNSAKFPHLGIEHTGELNDHAQFAIATSKLFRPGKPGNFLWTEPIFAFCPNKHKNLPDFVFIEPKVHFTYSYGPGATDVFGK